MRATQHPLNNGVLGAPAGMSIEQCHALSVTRCQYEDGTPGTASYWLPSAEELALLQAGMAVRLLVLGGVHPPVALGVDGDGAFP